MVIDDGLPLAYAQSVVEIGRRLHRPDEDQDRHRSAVRRAPLLEAKLALYGRPRCGLSSAANSTNTSSPCLARQRCRASTPRHSPLGFDTIEISDNTVPLSDAQRRGQIAGAVRAGLQGVRRGRFEGHAQQPRAAGPTRRRSASMPAPSWCSSRRPSW